MSKQGTPRPWEIYGPSGCSIFGSDGYVVGFMQRREDTGLIVAAVNLLARLGLAPDTAEAQVVALVRVAREAARALYDDKNEVFDPIRLELALAPFAGLEEGEP